MARIHYQNDADLSIICSKKVAVFGYGSQGHAHALNLRDSKVPVRVALPAESRSRGLAYKADFIVMTPAEATDWADVLAILAPDTSQPALFRDTTALRLRRGQTVLFAHGFNVHFNTISLPADVDVVMVAPKAPGHRVREVFVEGGGTPALLAVHQDATSGAKQTALSYAKAIGATRAGVLETSFREETETDLFGEQAVLCGGVSALVKAGFETLVEAGYQPEIAYFECLHELKLIVDLMYRGGLNFMRYSVSDTAEHGDYTAGPQIVTEETRQTMRHLLHDIQRGVYARKWVAENEAGRPWFNSQRRREQEHLIEQIGSRLRSMMPFVDPVAVRADGTADRSDSDSSAAAVAPAIGVPNPSLGTPSVADITGDSDEPLWGV